MDRTGSNHWWTRIGIPALALAIAAIPLVAGCRQPTTPASSFTSDPRAEEIAAKMLQAYRNAGAYADHATYVQHSVHRAEGVERDLPFFYMSLAFERPNRLRLSFEEAVEGSAGRGGFNIASNGAIIRATAGQLAGQIQESAAPRVLIDENFLPDPYLREIFKGRALGDVFPQLAMLLNKDDQKLVFPEDEAPRLLDDQKLRDRNCHRIASKSAAGTRILWIDRETYALHRMELPIDAQRRTLNPDSDYSDLSVWIDFEDVSFDADVVDKTFEMEIPKDARRVRRFVLPPPEAPPEQLGKTLDDYKFETLDGKPVTPETIAGKTVLLDFWQIDCPPCQAHTPFLEEVYDELKGADDFLFYAVNIEGSRVPDDAVENTFRSWGGRAPIIRDRTRTSFDKLELVGTPTLMLIDGKGRLQHLHVGAHQDPPGLVKLINRVRKGEDLAAQIRAEHRQLVKAYEQELESVTIADSVLDVEVARPKIAEQQLPAKFIASELWHTKTEDIRRPGNLLVLEGQGGDKAPRIVALDGGQAIVEFDADGKPIERHELPGEVAATTGFLRTIVDGASRRWIAASGVGWQKIHLFDENWKPVLAFPKERHPGIADVQLANHGDEPRLYVGYRGGVGVQGVGLDGRRKWSERSLDQVVQLALVPGASEDAPELWCTSSRGTILVLDAEGERQRELAVGLRALMHLAVAQVEGGVHCCGLAVEAVGRYDVVGFSPDGEVAWHYELPPGEYTHQVERVQHVTLPGGSPAWMIAAADGRILWLDHDGRLIDEFHYGQALTGVSLTNAADRAILLVSTPEKLTAWKLEQGTAKDAKSAKEE